MDKKFFPFIRTFFGVILCVQLSNGILAQANGDSTTKLIQIRAITGMQFDLVRFVVKPGAKVSLTFTNTDEMAHNLLITKPGARMDVVNAALKLAEQGPKLSYIPKMSEVMWAIPILSVGQSATIRFTAPAAPGVYPYVCTFPGHGFTMYGAMYVTMDDKLPPVSGDQHIPDFRRKDSASEKSVAVKPAPEASSPHPYLLTPPVVYRSFLAGASPAAIAVNLPGDLSYCWDAGPCKLRFAWKGGFIDNSDLWKGHADASAKVLGDIFYRDNLDYPLRLGTNAEMPVVHFKGYRLINRYPEFHYLVNGQDVYEAIREKPDGTGLVRSFRIPAASGPVWFYSNRQDDTMIYDFSAGKKEGNSVELTAAEARNFTVTMTSYTLFYKTKKR